MIDDFDFLAWSHLSFLYALYLRLRLASGSVY